MPIHRNCSAGISIRHWNPAPCRRSVQLVTLVSPVALPHSLGNADPARLCPSVRPSVPSTLSRGKIARVVCTWRFVADESATSARAIDTVLPDYGIKADARARLPAMTQPGIDRRQLIYLSPSPSFVHSCVFFSAKARVPSRWEFTQRARTDHNDNGEFVVDRRRNPRGNLKPAASFGTP